MNYHLFKYFQAVNEKPHLQSRGSEDADNFQFMRCKNQSVLLRAVIETEDSHSEQSGMDSILPVCFRAMPG